MSNRRVILIHGLHQFAWVMTPLAKRLNQHGFYTHQFGYRSLKHDIATHSNELNAWLKQNHDPNQPINLVGHSLGGLIIRDFAARFPKWQIGRAVTLGSPHLGSICANYVWRLAPPLVGKSYLEALDGAVTPFDETKLCLGVIAGTKPKGLGQVILNYHQKKQQGNSDWSEENNIHDGTVYLFETRLDGAADHLILPVSHTGMLLDKTVASQTAYFLQHGYFKHES